MVILNRRVRTLEIKIMERSPRLFLAQGVYHVYCRVARSEPVFEEEPR